MEQIKTFISDASMTDLTLLIIGLMFVVKATVGLYSIISDARKMKKELKARLKKLNENKCSGPHSWVDVPVNGENTHVCKDCYYTPKHDSFVDKAMFEAELSRINFDKNFEKYKTERFEEIAEKFALEQIVIEGIYDEVVGIKKEFSLKEMDKFIAELLKKDD